MKTNICNIQKNEKLADEVQRYPWLYHWIDSGYKDRKSIENAWKTV